MVSTANSSSWTNNTWTTSTANTGGSTYFKNVIIHSNPATATTTGTPDYRWYENVDLERIAALVPGTDYKMPDGAMLSIDHDGNYTLKDEDAKVIYQACRIRAFNRFLNASELLEAFIGDLGGVGIRQSEVLKVPVEAFINWLILRASEADGEPMLDRGWDHRCSFCMRFIPRRYVRVGINFCSPLHLDRYLRRFDHDIRARDVTGPTSYPRKILRLAQDEGG